MLRVMRVARADGRLEVVEEDKTGFDAVQRTAVFRFPDDISVRALNAGPGKSALGIYSRSRYGLSDFGANGRRVRRWIKMLNAAIASA